VGVDDIVHACVHDIVIDNLQLPGSNSLSILQNEFEFECGGLCACAGHPVSDMYLNLALTQLA